VCSRTTYKTADRHQKGERFCIILKTKKKEFDTQTGYAVFFVIFFRNSYFGSVGSTIEARDQLFFFFFAILQHLRNPSSYKLILNAILQQHNNVWKKKNSSRFPFDLDFCFYSFLPYVSFILFISGVTFIIFLTL